MTNLERLLEQSKDKNEIKDQMLAVMFEALTCWDLLNPGYIACIEDDKCLACVAISKIEQLAAQALGEK